MVIEHEGPAIVEAGDQLDRVHHAERGVGHQLASLHHSGRAEQLRRVRARTGTRREDRMRIRGDRTLGL
jgi:hypothetical protein